ncbi:MAG: peptide-methionine (S)-S-oxide reductase MsrA [Nanoarchaeota archaeon]|nr:peptide-methionine (S)-S-oxide reductase MsrA [Nanoarchaeota archaeon]
MENKYKKAVFGAGCFWSVEHDLSNLPGVIETSAGYMGGDEEEYPNPTYEQVCSDKTNYAEVVQVIFDPKKINYSQLLDSFWRSHDPTALNRQGPDIGTQYRSVIFYTNEEQKKEAEDSKKEFQKNLGKPIVTQILPAKTFFKAEEYHQHYLKKTGRVSCRI